MSRLANSARKTAKRLAEKYGNSISITEETTPGTYSRATGSVSAATTETHSVKVIFEPIPERLVNGDTIRSGDCMMYLAEKDLEFDPKPGMTFSHQSRLWKILGVQQVQAQDLAIIHEIHVRAIDGSD